MSEFTDKRDEMIEMASFVALLRKIEEIALEDKTKHDIWERHWRTMIYKRTGWSWIAIPEPPKRQFYVL